MITVKLYGKLGKRFGRKRVLNVKSPAEALRAIDTLDGGLFEMIAQMEVEVQGYHVTVADADIGKELLEIPCIGEVVTITPLLRGADTKGVLTIVAGVALIAIGIAASYYNAFLGYQIIGLGLALALGGVARLLMSSPTSGDQTQRKQRASYIFTNPINTIQQGECVPVCYGDMIVGSAVVSAGIDTHDIVKGSSSTTSDAVTSSTRLPISTDSGTTEPV
jgi:predicted phage tail protein